jgi:hypothetical protein
MDRGPLIHLAIGSSGRLAIDERESKLDTGASAFGSPVSYFVFRVSRVMAK